MFPSEFDSNITYFVEYFYNMKTKEFEFFKENIKGLQLAYNVEKWKDENQKGKKEMTLLFPLGRDMQMCSLSLTIPFFSHHTVIRDMQMCPFSFVNQIWWAMLIGQKKTIQVISLSMCTLINVQFVTTYWFPGSK